MTDLRCNHVIHLKALGNIIERKCPEHSRRASAPGHRVTVFHRWEYQADGHWVELNDRMVVQESPEPTP